MARLLGYHLYTYVIISMTYTLHFKFDYNDIASTTLQVVMARR